MFFKFICNKISEYYFVKKESEAYVAKFIEDYQYPLINSKVEVIECKPDFIRLKIDVVRVVEDIINVEFTV